MIGFFHVRIYEIVQGIQMSLMADFIALSIETYLYGIDSEIEAPFVT